MKKELQLAFKITLPVLFGYLVLGMAFGLMIQGAGYNFIWAFVCSLLCYAGSMQFVLVDLLRAGERLLSTALMTLSVNSRHIFYGLSFIEKFKSMGKRGWYMIFSLTDETYSLLCSVKTPEGMKENDLFFCIALLDHSYWITGSVIGALVGQLIPFNTAGVEFSMTALFVVIFLDQWKEYKSHLPAYIGFACGGLSLLLLGAKNFILPALVATVVLLLICRPYLTNKLVGEGE